MNEETQEKVEKYVYSNYKSYEGKTLIIKENDSHFSILKHKDGSPLILSKKIVE